MVSTLSVSQLVEQLNEAGNKLSQPQSTSTELLNLLDELELILAKVGQAPSVPVQEALLPSMKVLITDQLLRNSDINIKVSVAACLNEIMRITAPDAPYSDEKMKEIFELMVESFDNLSLVTGRCYSKAVSIVENVAKVRSCVMMLDLECDSLIKGMFEQFLKNIRSNHPQSVFLAMETIMTLIIDESELVPPELLKVLLTSVRRENEKNSPLSYELGAKVIQNSAEKLKPFLMTSIRSLSINKDDYAPTLKSICCDNSYNLEKNNDDSEEPMINIEPAAEPTLSHQNEDPKSATLMAEMQHEMESGSSTDRIGRKPDCGHLDDGHGILETETKGKEQSLASPMRSSRKHSTTPEFAGGLKIPSEASLFPKKQAKQVIDFNRKKPQSTSGKNSDGSKKRGRPKRDAAEGSGGKRLALKSKGSAVKNEESQTEETLKKKPQRKLNTVTDGVFETPYGKKNYEDDIVGCRIKVWWPEDKTYYDGVIVHFDPSKRRHQVDYDDGDVEVLNLRKEIWEFIGVENLLDEDQRHNTVSQLSSKS